MKKIIDTIKEIITKDASTQTEPVTIVENEEDMPQSGGQTESQQILNSEFKQKRDGYNVEIRKAKRGDILEKKRDKILSGQDHVEEQARLEEELEAGQQIKPHANFYDKCKAYLNNVDPTASNYISLKKAAEFDMNNNIDLNISIQNAFSAYMEGSDDEAELLQQATAALYIIFQENDTNLGKDMELKNAIYTDLETIVGAELSGEITSFLENYEV